jgi:GntR family transcriptional regulator
VTGVDRRSDRPVYRQVADVLRTAIRAGELVTGQQLPSEAELINRYGVSRTVCTRRWACYASKDSW